MMDNVNIEAYMADESVSVKTYELTPETDEIAVRYENGLKVNKYPDAADFMSAINKHGGDTGSCLDVGYSYGAQKLALNTLFPQMTWAGVEVAEAYRDKVLTRWPDAETYMIDSYTDMSTIPDASYDVVTSRSMLCHYSHANAFRIIDEMLRIAQKAVVIKLYSEIQWTPELAIRDKVELEDGDLFVPLEGVKEGKGFLVEWSLPAWKEYIADKNVYFFENNERVIVLCPPLH